MTTKAEKPSRLRREIQELAEAMHANGTINNAAYTKITMRNVEKIGTKHPTGAALKLLNVIRDKGIEAVL